MILKAFMKQPNETKDYDIEYSPWLLPMDDSLNEVDVFVTCLDDPDDVSLVASDTAITTTRLKVWLSGGTDGYKYKVTFIVSTVGGRIDESELIFVIGDM